MPPSDTWINVSQFRTEWRVTYGTRYVDGRHVTRRWLGDIRCKRELDAWPPIRWYNCTSGWIVSMRGDCPTKYATDKLCSRYILRYIFEIIGKHCSRESHVMNGSTQGGLEIREYICVSWTSDPEADICSTAEVQWRYLYRCTYSIPLSTFGY